MSRRALPTKPVRDPASLRAGQQRLTCAEAIQTILDEFEREGSELVVLIDQFYRHLAAKFVPNRTPRNRPIIVDERTPEGRIHLRDFSYVESIPVPHGLPAIHTESVTMPGPGFRPSWFASSQTWVGVVARAELSGKDLDTVIEEIVNENANRSAAANSGSVDDTVVRAVAIELGARAVELEHWYDEGRWVVLVDGGDIRAMQRMITSLSPTAEVTVEEADADLCLSCAGEGEHPDSPPDSSLPCDDCGGSGLRLSRRPLRYDHTVEGARQSFTGRTAEDLVEAINASGLGIEATASGNGITVSGCEIHVERTVGADSTP